MITSLRCQNFKCFRDTGVLKLAPITLLVGENNSGKSSILQALHIMALTADSGDSGVCLRLSKNQDYDYGSFEDLIFQHDENKIFTLSFGIDDGEDYISFSYGLKEEIKEIFLEKFIIGDSKGEKLKITQFKAKVDKVIEYYVNKKETLKLPSNLFNQSGAFFLLNLIELLNKPISTSNEVSIQFFKDVVNIPKFLTDFNVINHLGPLRDVPRRIYLYSGEIPRKVGKKGEFALQIYSIFNKRKDKYIQKIVELIQDALCQLGFFKDFKVKDIEDKYYELWTEHSESLFTANLVDTGFGASQVFPVLVSLFTSVPGTLLMYEQPEIHLHPAAQAELGSVFAKACSKDKRILIETHSENLILRIQTEVAKGKLTPEDVIIYYIQPDKDGHIVIETPLNEKGERMKEWPKGFFEEGYQESLKLSAARSEYDLKNKKSSKKKNLKKV